MQLLLHKLCFILWVLFCYCLSQLVLELEFFSILRVELNRVQWSCNWADEFVNETNHLLAIFKSDQVLYIEKFQRICRLNKDHAYTLTDILSYSAKFCEFIELVEINLFGTSFESFFNIKFILSLEFAVSTVVIICLFVHHHHFDIAVVPNWLLLFLLLLRLCCGSGSYDSGSIFTLFHTSG